VTVVVAAMAAAGGCGGDDSSSPSGSDGGAAKLHVVANFYPIAEALARVGGDRVEVSNLTPPGAEPHDLELTTDEVDKIQDADLVVYMGSGFQPGVAEAAGERSGPSLDIATVVTLQTGDSAAIEAQEGAESGSAAPGTAAPATGDDRGNVDPHFWLDPTLMSAAVDAIATELTTISPADAATFQANAAAYDAELSTLDSEFHDGLQGCARTQIVTSHAAFYYLAQRYGLQQLAITGLSPESEPDPSRLDDLADLIEQDGITTVFYETLVSPDIADTLARETGVTTAVLNPIEGLTDKQAKAGEDYLSVQRENLAALQLALGCPAG
jgi:zinc transport system substrate-binding protein